MRAPGTPTATRWCSRRPLFLLALLGFVLAGLLACQAPPAGAAGASSSLPPYLADAADPAVTTLARDRHISIAEARRRIGWQEPAMQLGEELRRALGDRFGGLWFDEGDGGRVKVGLVGSAGNEAAARIAARKLTAVTDLVPVRHSYAELERAHAWLSKAIIKANPPAARGADQRAGVRAAGRQEPGAVTAAAGPGPERRPTGGGGRGQGAARCHAGGRFLVGADPHRGV